MNTLLEYIGPIVLLVLILAYSIYRKFKPSDEQASKRPPTCPKCKSNKLQIIRPKRKQYSRKAAMVGSTINGMKGAMFAMLYEADRTHYRCSYCGHQFSRKENRFIAEQ